METVKLSDMIKSKVYRSCGVEVDHASQFLRAVIQKELFYCENYTRLRTRNSFTICYSHNGFEKYGFVQYFLSLNDQAVAVVVPLIVTTSPTCFPPELSVLRNRIKPVVLDSIVCIVHVKNIICKCVCIDTGSSAYVCRKPCQLSLD